MESSRVEAAATHDGITVAVRQIAVTATQTALDLELRGDNVATFMGIGGYHNLRLDGTALILRDQTGAQYRELVETARARRAVFDRDFAVFEPLSSEARSLELAVPYVFVEEARGSFEIELPVDAPASGLFGTCLVRVLSVHTVIAAPEVHNPMYRTRSLGAQIDAGGWQGERRLLLPARLLVDRAPSGIRLAKGIDCVAPEPVDYFEAADEGPSTARTLTLLGPIVQVRGPWSVRFARP